jgi:archaellum biogenesis ATPase FlaH
MRTQHEEFVRELTSNQKLLTRAEGQKGRKSSGPRAELGALVQCFADIEPELVRWLWPGRIPLGKLTLLIGDPGLGKSLVTVDLAARLSRGVAFPDGAACERGSTIFVSAEDDKADTIRPRLDAAGADVSRVHVLESVRISLPDGGTAEKGFSLESDIAHLEAALEKLTDIRLIVIDPLSAYLGGTDSHSNAEIRGLLSPIAAMAARQHVAILAVSHLRKSPGAAVHRAIGSIAFAAAARAVWAVALDPADAERRLMLPVKQNLSAPASGLAFRVIAPNDTSAARLEWQPGTVSLRADDVLGESAEHDGGALGEAKEWLAGVLADGLVAARDIQRQAKGAGIAWRTVRRAADSLQITRRKQSFGGGWEWSLPEHVQGEGGQASDSNLDTFEELPQDKTLTGERRSEDVQQSMLGRLGEDEGEVRV